MTVVKTVSSEASAKDEKTEGSEADFRCHCLFSSRPKPGVPALFYEGVVDVKCSPGITLSKQGIIRNDRKYKHYRGFREHCQERKKTKTATPQMIPLELGFEEWPQKSRVLLAGLEAYRSTVLEGSTRQRYCALIRPQLVVRTGVAA